MTKRFLLLALIPSLVVAQTTTNYNTTSTSTNTDVNGATYIFLAIA